MNSHPALRFKVALQDLLFPKGLRCDACKQTLLPYETQSLCLSCQTQYSPQPRQRILDGLPIWIAAPYDENWRGIIHRFKYERERYLADILGQALQSLLYPREKDLLLIPVPAHKKRIRERGFCQTNDLVHALATLNGCDFDCHSLRRIRATQAQAHLDAQQRRDNVKSAFSAHQNLRGRTCLLVDDVVSTGATLGECQLALQNVGANLVGAIAVAGSGNEYRHAPDTTQAAR